MIHDSKLYSNISGSAIYKKNDIIPTTANTNNIKMKNNISNNPSSSCIYSSINNITYNNLKKKNVSICSTFRSNVINTSTLQNTVSFGNNGTKTKTNSNQRDNISFCNIRISGHKNENVNTSNNNTTLTTMNNDLL